jgi:hypothetical protein
MVKKTKLRPRRLFYDKSKNKYYYLIEGKKTFIKTGDVSQKQLVKINIKNIVPTRAPAKRRREPAETTLITSSKKVAPTLLAPISANLTPNLNLYKLKDSEKLGEKITSLEKKIEVLSDTTKTKIPKPTTPKPTTPKPTTPKPTTPKPTTPTGAPPLGKSESSSIKKPVGMNKNIAGKLIDKFISEGGKSYAEFKNWFNANQGEVVDGQLYSKYEIKQDFAALFKTKYDIYTSRPEYTLATDLLSKPPPENKKEEEPAKKGIMTMADLNKEPVRVRTYAEAFKQGLSKVATALSPKSSKVAPEPTRTSTMTLTTTEDDNPVDAGDINVPAGVPETKEESSDEDKPIVFKKTGKGKEHENDNDGIYNDELEQIFYVKLHKFVPVIASDQMGIIEKMVNKNTKKIGWIQNTDPQKSKGRHWVAYFINIPEGEINYYDSLVENNGMPSAESMKGLKKIIDKINPEFYLKFKNNLCRFQNPKSNNCGYFSLKFLLDRYSNIPFRECTGYDKVVDKYGEGEKMIQKFKRYL